MAEEAFFIKSEKTIQLKKAIAKCLYKKNYDQLEISKLLNLSQPMVSNYIYSKENFDPNLLEYADKICLNFINGINFDFYTCVSFGEDSHEGRYYITEKNEIINDENIKIIDNLMEAFNLLKNIDISGLIPEVKINIAMAKEGANNTDDVAAFLNGLVIVNDKITSNNGVRFGKSKHLSILLLYLKQKLNINSIMNVSYLKNIKNLDFKVAYLSKDYKIDKKLKNVDLLLHKGDFGIEPSTYILGKNSVEVVKKLLKIIDGKNNVK